MINIEEEVWYTAFVDVPTTRERLYLHGVVKKNSIGDLIFHTRLIDEIPIVLCHDFEKASPYND